MMLAIPYGIGNTGKDSTAVNCYQSLTYGIRHYLLMPFKCQAIEFASLMKGNSENHNEKINYGYIVH